MDCKSYTAELRSVFVAVSDAMPGLPPAAQFDAAVRITTDMWHRRVRPTTDNVGTQTGEDRSGGDQTPAPPHPPSLPAPRTVEALRRMLADAAVERARARDFRAAGGEV